MIENKSLNSEAAEVLRFWLGDSVAEPAAIANRMSTWFGSEDLDREIERRFGSRVKAARQGRLRHWASEAHGRLALIILLDQFPRNLFRGSADAFASDAAALAICEQSIDDGALTMLAFVEQAFMLMPLQHAESRLVQQRSVSEFEKLAARVEESQRQPFAGFVKYACLHKEIIDRFGRFPHRNAILGRTSTTEERAYLAGDAPSFGQRSQDH